jgi:hypothetical protein
VAPHAASAPAALTNTIVHSSHFHSKPPCGRSAAPLAELPLCAPTHVDSQKPHPKASRATSACGAVAIEQQQPGQREPQGAAEHVPAPHIRQQISRQPSEVQDTADRVPPALQQIPSAHPAGPENAAQESQHTRQAAGHVDTSSSSGRLAAAQSLTSEQREVVRRVLSWDDYVLVSGLPGAGKTSTICALAQVCSCSVAAPAIGLCALGIALHRL